MGDTRRSVVAVVDDDDAVREALRFLIQLIGHEVEVFAGAAEFLKAELRHVACLVLDHHMPKMTGLQLAEQLRTAGVRLPIMLITAAPTPEIFTRAAELGIRQVIVKPPTEAQLIAFLGGTGAA